jgi:hypothetical protein
VHGIEVGTILYRAKLKISQNPIDHLCPEAPIIIVIL